MKVSKENIIQNVLPPELKNEIEKGFFEGDVLKEKIVNYVEGYAANLKKCNISQASIRKIYESFKNLQLRMHQELMKNLSDNLTSADFEKAEEEAYRRIAPFLKLMRSKSRYAVEKKKGELGKKDDNEKEGYQSLNEFIDLCINNIKTKKDFDAFMDLFECIVANLKEA